MASNPSRLLLVSAFASVYLIWGSTYLAIRFTIETIPPFLMAAVRFLLAGGILFLWERLKGTPIPGFKKWRTATILGALLLLGGNGGVVWAEQFVPSGLTALLIATEPMWVIILSFLLLRNLSLNRQLFFGLLIGFAGMILLVGPGDLQSENSIDPIGAAVILLAALSWAAGSVYGSRVDLKTTPFMATSMQMLTGGVLLGVFSFANSEWSDFNLNQVSLSSILALTYLIIFGALIAFTAYIWIIRNVSPTPASTYAFVNPVVAVFLGWAIAGEPVGWRTIIAALLIITAVVLIIMNHSQRSIKPKQSIRLFKRIKRKRSANHDADLKYKSSESIDSELII